MTITELVRLRIATVQGKQTKMQIDDRLVNLEPGMAVTVEIKTGTRRIIEYLMARLLRYKRESLSLWRSCWLVGCLASLVLASISGTSASERTHRSPEIERAQILLDRSDCAGAWNTLWPLAKDGNQEARLFLFTSLPRMFPPPVAQDGDRWHYQHLLVLAAYAALTPPDQLPPVMRSGRAFRHEVFAAIANLRLGPDGQRVARCYTEGRSLKKCLNLGLSIGVIPRFDDYARQFEAAARQMGQAARCFRD